MKIINSIATIGIIILVISTIIILIKYCKENNIIFPRRRSNRISPRTFFIIASLIQERNQINIQRYVTEEKEKEIELTEIRNKNNNTVIIINPDNKIELGQSNKI
jgi:hypothetical protein